MRLGRCCRFSLLAVLVLVAGPAWAQPEVDATRLYLGAAGATCALHAAAGTPSTSLGTVCDVYKQQDSPYTIYVKTGASTWTAVLNMPSSASAGDLITAASATVLGRIAAVAAGQVLASNGTGTPPAYTASPSLTAIGGAANLTLNPTGDLVLNPTGNDVLPTTNYDINLGALATKYLTLHAAELWVETLVAQNTIATIGGRILVGPTTTLTSDLSTGATSIVVKHNQMASGDRVYLEADGKVEFIAVTSGASGSGPYTYSVTRNLDGTGANQWYAGDAVFNTGTTGDGFIDLYSVSAVNGPTKFGPTIAGNVRTGTTYSDIDTRWAIGNLNGLYGYSADTYGAAFGDNSNAWVKIDPTNGVRIGEASTTYFQVDPSGNATFAGQVTVGLGGRNQLSNTEFMRGRSTGRPTHLAGIDGTEWGAYFDETTSLTWLQGTTGAGGTCLGTNYQPRSGGAGCFAAAGTPNNAEYFRAWGPHLPVTAGQRLEFSYYALPYRSRVYPRIIFYNASGVYVTETDGTEASSGTRGPTATSTAQNADIANWSRVWNISVVPANAVVAVPVIMGSWFTGDGADPFVFYTRVYFGEAQPGQLTASPWMPGGYTLIDGEHLTTDLVISNTLRSSGATSATAGAGYWLDATSTPTFRIGEAVSGGNDFLYWDGSALKLQSATLTVDSTGIQLAPRGTSSWADTNAYRFTTGGSDQLGLFGYRDGSAQTVTLGSTSSTLVALASMIASDTTNTAQFNVTSGGNASLLTFNGTLYGGDFDIGAIPDFLGATSGSAGSSAGFINVKVGGTALRIQVFNP